MTWNLSAAGSVASCVTLVEGDCTTWDAAALHGDILSLRSDRDAEVLGRGAACHGARDGLGLVAGSASYNCDGGQGRPVLASRRLERSAESNCHWQRAAEGWNRSGVAATALSTAGAAWTFVPQ